jgi:tetratricopeptide (TPR) repeat protein
MRRRFPMLLIGLFVLLIALVTLPEPFYRNVWAVQLNKLLWSDEGIQQGSKAESNTTSALDRLQQDLAWAPRAESTRKLMGVAFHLSGQTEAALAEWQALPDLKDYLLNWGNCSRSQGRPDDAMAWYLLAGTVAPSSSIVWYRVGETLRDQARWQDALQAFRRALQEDNWDDLNDEQADAYHQTVLLLFRESRWSEAMSTLQDALAVAPTSVNLWGDLAWASYQSSGNFEQAAFHMQTALDLSPGDTDLLLRAGDLYRVHRDYDEALQWITQARDAAPDLVWPVIAQGRIEFDRGSYASAVQAFGDAASMSPDTARAHFWLGKAYQAMGQWANAIDAYETAFKLMPQQVEFGIPLGDAYRQVGMMDEAMAVYQQLSRYHPTHSGVNQRLKEMYEQP